eukprot:TRINITY_DN34102_c0_g1_i1.p1 TRINITY_DN34102_c0_g1~~TRINITY_DN34102_c0_g1_i1.p1  ORF type:complete len:200 (+),score=54.96 TRINITY_DN34102_c0_g1_i1:83-601(+)
MALAADAPRQPATPAPAAESGAAPARRLLLRRVAQTLQVSPCGKQVVYRPKAGIPSMRAPAYHFELADWQAQVGSPDQATEGTEIRYCPVAPAQFKGTVLPAGMRGVPADAGDAARRAAALRLRIAPQPTVPAVPELIYCKIVGATVQPPPVQSPKVPGRRPVRGRPTRTRP